MNYRQLFARKKATEQKLVKNCPILRHSPGIYVLTRIDDDSYAYVGQSVDVLDRLISHYMGYAQRIDISLKKRGLYTPDNLGGWRIMATYCDRADLDARERQMIDYYIEQGFCLYNITDGGQGKGKADINTRKASKGYRDGLEQGYKKAQQEIKKLFEKNLVAEINGKPNKLKEKAMEKFTSFLKKY